MILGLTKRTGIKRIALGKTVGVLVSARASDQLVAVASEQPQPFKLGGTLILTVGESVHECAVESFLDVNLAQLCEEIDKAEMINEPVEVTLTITPNGKNLIFTFDERAENSVSGGALSEIKRIYSGS